MIYILAFYSSEDPCPWCLAYGVVSTGANDESRRKVSTSENQAEELHRGTNSDVGTWDMERRALIGPSAENSLVLDTAWHRVHEDGGERELVS